MRIGSPRHHPEIVGVGLGDEFSCRVVCSRQKLTGSRAYRGGDRRGHAIAEEKAGHHQGIELMYAFEDTSRKREDHATRHFV